MSDSVAQKFADFFPTLSNDILAHLKTINIPVDAFNWLDRMMNYNVPGGKMNRGLSVHDTYAALVGRPLTEDEVTKAFVLGWTVEWLQAFFLVADDIMDRSITRRGQPCWYKNPEVGNFAINDSFALESAIYILLKKYFRTEAYYVDLLELMLEVTSQTVFGQLVDLITAPEDNHNIELFSMERYQWIIQYKTAYYSFYLPVAFAMLMNGMSPDNPAFKIAEKILLEMGQYFQATDDYLDCYADPEVLGKIGTDIQDNKCSWLANRALQLFTPEQKERFAADYGKNDPEAIARVKALYNEIDLEAQFRAYEQESYDKINAMIAEVPAETINPEIFTIFLRKIFKRKK
ncbi:isoprenoid biosynthesis-like protein [Fonticula alba]|uniref:Isoprenoid biosynthesis-like protein n=1 Tax=Fonticula alba TaxID=691883 RepID=A0A058ZFT9_FONAL|nr:isoprenoid biosynthesis-like protein [Fonticula alba]KCV73224.1 isoprenoid biosynthesis-like protein [Fonticula alba]|eukprot:XP_009492925.1 isoprenoid biosynthesis-like protein [Fonticula alba]